MRVGVLSSMEPGGSRRRVDSEREDARVLRMDGSLHKFALLVVPEDDDGKLGASSFFGRPVA
jgi:hypothetical protein